MNCPPPLFDQLTVEQFNRGCDYLDQLMESGQHDAVSALFDD